MSRDDKLYLKLGYYVRHKFGRYRRGRHQCCERCGVKRRRTTAGWEWTDPQFKLATWSPYNPPCIKKASS